jgi:HK97 family phage prohead protease
MEDSMTEEAAAQVKCPNCGYMNSPDATMCAECGAPMPTGASSLTALEQAGLRRGDTEVRIASLGDWEIRHSGRADEAFTVRGYAAVYEQLSHDLGGFRERITPGFFDAILETNPHVVFSWEHDNRYVGASTPNTLALRSDNTGLLVDAQIGNYSWAKDLKLSIERGDNAQGSFAFKVGDEGDDWQIQEDGSVVRTLLPGGASGLYDVTVCAQGAYPQTSMAAVRSLAAVRGRLPEAGAILVAPPEVGEQESQPGSEADPEIETRRSRLLNRAAVARDDIGALSERLGKL